MAGVPPKRATSQAQPAALAGAKATSRIKADQTLETSGNGGVSVQNSLHGRPVTERLSDSTPAAVPCLAVDNPAEERPQELPSIHVQVAQNEDSVMLPLPQVCTVSNTTLTKDKEQSDCNVHTITLVFQLMRSFHMSYRAGNVW